MKRLLLIASFAAVVAGCNDESGGGSGSLSVKLKQPTFVIDDSSKQQVDVVAVEYASVDGYGPDLITGDTVVRIASRSGLERTLPRIASRISDSGSLDCDSGSGSWTGSATGVSDTGEMQSSGTISSNATYNDCKNGSSDYYTIDDGKISLDMSWSGYQSSTETLSSWGITVRFSDYSYEEYYYGDTIKNIMDGAIKVSGNDSEARLSMALSFSSPELNNQIITMETTSDIVQGLSDPYPSSGGMVIKGGNDTKVTYNIVANGVEVSLNGGQAELVAWSEIDGY